MAVHNAGKCALVVGSSVDVFRVESEGIARRRLKHMKFWIYIEGQRRSFGVAGNAGLDCISTYSSTNKYSVYTAELTDIAITQCSEDKSLYSFSDTQSATDHCRRRVLQRVLHVPPTVRDRYTSYSIPNLNALNIFFFCF